MTPPSPRASLAHLSVVQLTTTNAISRFILGIGKAERPSETAPTSIAPSSTTSGITLSQSVKILAKNKKKNEMEMLMESRFQSGDLCTTCYLKIELPDITPTKYVEKTLPRFRAVDDPISRAGVQIKIHVNMAPNQSSIPNNGRIS